MQSVLNGLLCKARPDIYFFMEICYIEHGVKIKSKKECQYEN